MLPDHIQRARHAEEPAPVPASLEIPYAPQDGVDAPAALPLLPGGARIQGRDGRAYTHPDPMATLRRLEQDFAEYPMVLDENHALEIAAPQGEPSPALARLRGFALRSDGSIWATQVEWTPYGLERVRQKAYVGVSPTVLFDSRKSTGQDKDRTDGEILTIVNCGLVNEPNFVMPALHSRANPEQDMNEEQLKKLLTEAMAGLREEFSAKVADLGTQVQAVLESQQAAVAASHAQRVEEALDRAEAARRIAPASRAYHSKAIKTAEDLAAFESFYLKGTAPAVVSNDRPAVGRAQHKRSAANASKDERRLARDMGIDLTKAAEEPDQDDDLSDDALLG